MTLEEIRALVKDDLASVNDVIRALLKSAVPLVDQIAEHIIAGGGKRLRPMLVVLAGRACGHKGSAHIEAAAFIVRRPVTSLLTAASAHNLMATESTGNTGPPQVRCVAESAWRRSGIHAGPAIHADGAARTKTSKGGFAC